MSHQHPSPFFPLLKWVISSFKLLSLTHAWLVYGFCSLFSVADPAEESGGPGPTLSLDRNEALI